MIHQPWGGVGGTALDISIQADEILRLKDTLNGIRAKLGFDAAPVRVVLKSAKNPYASS